MKNELNTEMAKSEEDKNISKGGRKRKSYWTAEERQLAFRDIDECLYRILKDSLVYLDSKNITVDPMTQRTYDYYKKEMGKED